MLDLQLEVLAGEESPTLAPISGFPRIFGLGV